MGQGQGQGHSTYKPVPARRCQLGPELGKGTTMEPQCDSTLETERPEQHGAQWRPRTRRRRFYHWHGSANDGLHGVCK